MESSSNLRDKKKKKNPQTCISSVQSLSHVWLFMIPWTAARQATLSWWSWLRLMSIESVMPSNHLILCGLLQSFPASGSFPADLHTPWFFPQKILNTKQAETHHSQTPDLQNCAAINGCYFNPQRLWWFVMVAIENQSWHMHTSMCNIHSSGKLPYSGGAQLGALW